MPALDLDFDVPAADGDTTVLSSIIANYRDAIEATPPTRLPNYPYRRTTRRMPIEDLVVANPGSGLLRHFEMRMVLGAVDSITLDPRQGLMIEPAELIVAYPTQVALYGKQDLDSMENIIRRDARQLHDILLSPGNYISGQNGALPGFGTVEQSRDVWLLRIPVMVHYFESQTFT
jgi:hypothetical protein